MPIPVGGINTAVSFSIHLPVAGAETDVVSNLCMSVTYIGCHLSHLFQLLMSHMNFAPKWSREMPKVSNNKNLNCTMQRMQFDIFM